MTTKTRDAVEEVVQRQLTVAGLRQLADWLEANPDVPVTKYDQVGVVAFGSGKAEAGAVALAAPKMDKRYTSGLFEGSVKFAGNVRYEINIAREQVCTKRVVGTKHVEEVTYPAHDEDVVEWDCTPILGS